MLEIKSPPTYPTPTSPPPFEVKLVEPTLPLTSSETTPAVAMAQAVMLETEGDLVIERTGSALPLVEAGIKPDENQQLLLNEITSGSSESATTALIDSKGADGAHEQMELIQHVIDDVRSDVPIKILVPPPMSTLPYTPLSPSPLSNALDINDDILDHMPNSIATSSDSRLSTTMSVQPHLPFASTSRSPSTSTLPSPRPTFGTSDQYNSMTDQSLFPLASSNLSDYRIATSDRSPSGSGHSTPLSFTAEKEKPKRGRKKGKKVVELKGEIQLIGDLPVAEESASKAYTEIEECTYANKSLGNLPFEEEYAPCDCSYDKHTDNAEQACGEDAQCMNVLMQIECSAEDCKCRRHCQNQKFAKRQYAALDIVRTEKKGFGVRARESIKADQFIYEYVGEVIGPSVFAKKMKEYHAEGIRHFYFMALDKETFIDATKKGGKGRFLNHSCAPNCVVAKWTVGRKSRMGIFAKRDILENEELTFNYNVDRYGHAAQECHCGELNCTGSIGGKTQTDLGGMEELYLDALGITDEVDADEMRGTKKKKSRKLDEDFTPVLKPITESEEAAKVAAAIRQAIQNKSILEKLLQRIVMTNDEEIQRGLLRLHGFNNMSQILRVYPNDIQIITLNLEILSKWPLMSRNKVESSKIEASVNLCALMDDETIKELAVTLLTTWSGLQLAYRIPKSASISGGAGGDDQKRSLESTTLEQLSKRARLDDTIGNEMDLSSPRPAPSFVKPLGASVVRTRRPAPYGWSLREDTMNHENWYYYNHSTKRGQIEYPRPDQIKPVPVASATVVLSVDDMIANVQATADAVMAKAQAEKDEIERVQREAKDKVREERKNGHRDKKVLALFSAIVIGVMSKYKADLGDSEHFKKRAKEVTALLCDKEKRHPAYLTEAYDALSTEKTAKVKAFTKDWVKKLVARSAERRTSSSTASSSRSRVGSLNGSSSAGVVVNGGLATPSSVSERDSTIPLSAIDEESGGGSTNSGGRDTMMKDA